MNSQIPLKDLKGVLSIMDNMLAEAKNENWAELTSLDDERRFLLGYETNTASASASMQSSVQAGTMPKPATTVHESVQRPSAGSRLQTAAKTEYEKEYKALCEHILVLDKKITQTVQEARQTLLNENRSLKAQVSAKNKYAQICSSQEASFG